MNVREELKAFVDRELSPADHARIAEMAAKDPQLAREIEEIRAVSGTLRKSVATPTPVGLEATLRALESNRKQPWFSRGRWLTIAQVAAAAVTVSVVVPLMVFTFTSRQNRAEAPSGFQLASGVSESARPAEFGRSRSTGVTAEDRSTADPRPTQPTRLGAPEVVEDRAGAPMRNEKTGGVETTTAPVPGVELQTPPLTREVLRSANLEVLVEDAVEAQQEATRMARSLAGFVETNNRMSEEGERPVTYVVVRIPEGRFEEALDAVRAMGKVTSEKMDDRGDATAAIDEMEARLKVLRQEEEQYVAILDRTDKIGDILSVRERLSAVRQKIESLDAQRKSFKNQAAYTAIRVTFEQRPASEPVASAGNRTWYGDVWAASLGSLAWFGRQVGAVVIMLAVFSPIWVPVAALAWWATRRVKG